MADKLGNIIFACVWNIRINYISTLFCLKCLIVKQENRGCVIMKCFTARQVLHKQHSTKFNARDLYELSKNNDCLV